MLKLYFKKLFFTIIFIINFFVLAGALAFVWHLIFRYRFPEPARTIIIVILAIILDFGIVCRMRYKKCKKSYVETNFINIIKSKDGMVHLLAFISIFLPFFVSIAVIEKTPVLPLIVGTIILLVFCGLIFFIVNSLLWFAVHKFIRYKRVEKYKNK